MTKFFNIFKNPVFGPFLAHFPNFGGKKICLENPALSLTTSYGFLDHAKIWKKLMIQFQENARTDGRTDGRTDRSYFIGPFRLTPGSNKNS